MSRIFEMFEDSNGKVSMQRVLTFIICLGVFSVWLYISFTTVSLAAVNFEQLALVLGPLGVKALQTFGEKKK